MEAGMIAGAQGKAGEDERPLLEVIDAHVWFPVRTGAFGRISGYVKAVDGASLSLGYGEVLGLVGGSGCGKTTLSRAILGLEPLHSGRILVEGRDVASFKSRADRMAKARAVGVVLQDPFASLNPRHTVLDILTEGMVAHGLATTATRRAEAERLLAAVGLDKSILDRHPHAFSGGQRQRMAIARAISLRPKAVICDEAVSALDLSVRAQIVNLLLDLRDEFGLSYLFISHDMDLVRHVADRIVTMKDGRTVGATMPAKSNIGTNGNIQT